MPLELYEQLRAVLKGLKQKKPELIPSTARRDEICNVVLATTLATKLSQFPASIEADEQLLQEGGLAKRHRMAVEVRLGEMRLLQEVRASLLEGQKRDKDEDDDERPKKRLKTKV